LLSTPQDKAIARPLAVAEDYGTVSTSDAYADKIAMQIGRFFSMNTPFSHYYYCYVDSPSCQILRPGYRPPSQKQLGGKILDEVHDNEVAACQKVLSAEAV